MILDKEDGSGIGETGEGSNLGASGAKAGPEGQ